MRSTTGGWAIRIAIEPGTIGYGASAAPANTCASCDCSRKLGGAWAWNVVAARSAHCLRVHSGGHGRTANRVPARIESAHRRNIGQLAADVVPISCCGLTRRRTSGLGRASRAQSASASPIAAAVKRRPCTTPRGTTVIVCSQAQQRKRRTRSCTDSGGASESSGPRSCLARLPCPWITSRRPAGRLAAPHHGHLPGRQASTDGIAVSQSLTWIALRTIPLLLRVLPFNLDPGHDGERAPTRFPSPISSCASAPMPRPFAHGVHHRVGTPEIRDQDGPANRPRDQHITQPRRNCCSQGSDRLLRNTQLLSHRRLKSGASVWYYARAALADVLVQCCIEFVSGRIPNRKWQDARAHRVVVEQWVNKTPPFLSLRSGSTRCSTSKARAWGVGRPTPSLSARNGGSDTGECSAKARCRARPETLKSPSILRS